MPPVIAHRQRDKLREGARTIHTHARRKGAEVAASGKTVAAAPTGDMSFAADNIAGMKVVYIRSNLDDLTNKLVADHHRHRNRLLRPLVPVVDMDICPANAGVAHPDKDVIDAILRFRNILQPQAGLAAALRQCLHHSPSRLARYAEPDSLTCARRGSLRQAKGRSMCRA